MTRRTAAMQAVAGTLEPFPRDRHCHVRDDQFAATGAFQMTQTSNRFFDEIGRLMNDAAGAAQGVKREEFDAVKDMARLAREENEALKTRIAALEAKLGISSTPEVGNPNAGG